MEGPGQVLSGGQVDGGFPAHGAVYHGQKCGWNLEVRHTPEVCGGGKAGQVTSDAAAQGHQQILSGDLVLGEKVQKIQVSFPAFGGFPLGEDIGADKKTGLLQGGLRPLAVQGGNGAVRD